MSEQTLSEEEVRAAIQDPDALSPEEVQQKLAKLQGWQSLAKVKGKRDRALIKAAAKMKKGRVLKPKPKRRPKKFITIISIAGKPVEGLEDAFTRLS